MVRHQEHTTRSAAPQTHEAKISPPRPSSTMGPKNDASAQGSSQDTIHPKIPHRKCHATERRHGTSPLGGENRPTTKKVGGRHAAEPKFSNPHQETDMTATVPTITGGPSHETDPWVLRNECQATDNYHMNPDQTNAIPRQQHRLTPPDKATVLGHKNMNDK